MRNSCNPSLQLSFVESSQRILASVKVIKYRSCQLEAQIEVWKIFLEKTEEYYVGSL